MVFTYTILCTACGCNRPAHYKIASRWSDGLTKELKTYGLACEKCLSEMFRQSLQKQKECRLAQGEILEPPGIFRLDPSRQDMQLERQRELERQIGA